MNCEKASPTGIQKYLCGTIEVFPFMFDAIIGEKPIKFFLYPHKCSLNLIVWYFMQRNSISFVLFFINNFRV